MGVSINKATAVNVKVKLKQLLDKTIVINEVTFTFKFKIMYTDNGPEFANNTIAKLLKDYDIKQIFGTNHIPQS